MSLRIYNSVSNSKETFVPIEEGKVSLYVCGMTVYDLCHVGHARVMVVFDTVVRYLRFSGYDVKYIRNITDIDDKIINRSNENGEEFNLLTERFIEAMHEDEQALNVLSPDDEPRATAYMPQIIEMINKLVKNKAAYAADNGDVYYDVSQFENYGSLSGKNTDDLRSGERVAIDENKDDPLDFVLWKAAKENEPYWESPWGNGRPGWHIECSAMSTCCLGNHFDIHGGGQDLQFPHHENEIAQSEAATGEKFVNLWMHNGFVRIDDEKMSKSLGNFFTLREVLGQYCGEEIRYFIVASQYRSPLNYSNELLDNARISLTRLYTALRGFKDVELDKGIAKSYSDRFCDAMDEDFNTPLALAVLFDIASEINKHRDVDDVKAGKLAVVLKHLGRVLGLLEQDPDAYLKGDMVGLDENAIDQLIQQRLEAKQHKDWAEADRIRDELAGQGIVLEDKGSETTWRRR